MKKSICLFTLGEDLNKIFIVHSKIILELKKEFGSFTIISFSNFLQNEEVKKIDIELLKKLNISDIEFFFPKTKKDFNKYVEDKKIYGIDCMGINYIKSWKFRRIVNKKNISLVLILDGGYISNEVIIPNIGIKNIFYESKRYILRKIYRLLVLINFFPPIFIYFDCRKNIVDHFLKNKKFHYIEKYFPFLNIFNIKNIYHINNKSFNYSNLNEDTVSENKIIFIDGNYKNEEFLFRENLDFKEIEQYYFKYISKVLKKLEEIYEQKVEICLHPSSDEKTYQDFFNKIGIHVSKGDTREKIFQASVVLFHESSAIIDAIYLKKKIISLKTDLFGGYHSERVELYKRQLNLLSIDIKDDIDLSKDRINKKHNECIPLYEKYLNKLYTNDDNEKGSEKIVRILKTFIN